MLPRAIAPRLLFATLTLTLCVVCVVSLAMFVNSRMVIDRFVDASVELRRDNLSAQLEARLTQATGALEREIDGLMRDQRIADLQRALDESAAEIASISGIRVLDTEGEVIASAGDAAGLSASQSSVAWQADRVVATRDIALAGNRLGALSLAFSLEPFNREIDAFRTRQLEIRRDWRTDATAWVVITSLVMALVCGAASLFMARRIVSPVEDITRQARRLAMGDFGEPVEESRSDELGQLARSFNRMRDQLRQTTISRDYIDNVLGSMNDAVIVTSIDGAITHANAAALRLTGYTETQLIGRPVGELVADRHRVAFETATPSTQPREASMINAAGNSVPVSWTCSEIETNDPMLAGRIYAAQDVTERKRSEERIRYLARIDPLTKVPNRMQFQHLLQRAISHARRNRTALALFYVDVDQFKDINDSFGHLAGDTTLEILTRCMARALPEGAVIGRLAGDEFAAFIDNLPLIDDMQDSLRGNARDLLTEIAEPFDVQGNEVYMTASLGIALYPTDADNVIDLLRNADAALYATKKAGGNRFSFYDASMNDAAVERLMLKSRLRRSFERDELMLQYQPKYELASGRIVGAEALVRWESPEHGLIQPNEFIPLAEETGLIVEIGEWVIERVCEDIESWRANVGEPGRIAINLSLKQLRHKSFFNRINRIFSRYNIHPSDVEFEITESTLMEDIPRTVEILDKLRAYGLELAIDDFGTGYSSLSALQKFPIKTLKIDRSFVTNAAVDENDAAIVQAIVDMSRSLRLDVVAEGIETEPQLTFLRRLNCDYGQGMLFGQPMAAGLFAERLLQQQDGTDRLQALFG
ncbi:MAG: EAL domain-containing protein [Pseudomonadota bacterium]